MPRIIGPDSDIVRRIFLEASEAVGCSAVYREVKLSTKDLYNDPTNQYEDPIMLEILFDENPKVKVMKSYGWYNEDDEIRPLLIYLPIYKNIHRDLLNVMEESIVEIVYAGVEKRALFKISAKRLDSLFGNYWICKCVPERRVCFHYNPEDGFEFLGVNKNIITSENITLIDTSNNSFFSTDSINSEEVLNVVGDNVPIPSNSIRLSALDNYGSTIEWDKNIDDYGDLIPGRYDFFINSTGIITVDWGDGTTTIATGDQIGGTYTPPIYDADGYVETEGSNVGGQFGHTYTSNNGYVYVINITSTEDITRFAIDEYTTGFQGILTANFNTPKLNTLEYFLVDCDLLTSVTLPDTLEDVTIAYQAFSWCKSLKTVDISSLVNVVDATQMFLFAIELETIDISSLTNLVTATGLFNTCTSLHTITGIEALSNVQYANFAFLWCTSLTSIDASFFTNVTGAYIMFFGCTSLTSIDISSMVNLIDAYFMFAYCELLDTIDVSELTLLEDVSYMFYGCSTLTDIGMTKEDFKSLVSLNNSEQEFTYTFNGTLIPDTLPDNMIRLKVSGDTDFYDFTVTSSGTVTILWGDENIDDDTFTHQYYDFHVRAPFYIIEISSTSPITEFIINQGSIGIITVELTTQLTTINDFYNSLSTRDSMGTVGEGELIITEVTDKGDTSIATSKNWLVTYDTVSFTEMVWNTTLPSYSNSDQIIIPAIDGGVYNCTVDWGDGTQDIITTWDDPKWTHTYDTEGEYNVTLQGQFEGFNFYLGWDVTKLVSIISIGEGFIFGTTEGGYLRGCTNLVSADLRGGDYSTLVNANIFTDCSNLVNVDISGCSFPLVTSLDMFGYCSSLTTLDLSTCSFPSLTSLDYGFTECFSLTTLIFNNSDMSNITTASYAFENCNLLNNIDLSSFTSLTDASYMFTGCTSLTTLDTSGLSSLLNAEGMFSSCTSLTTLDLSSLSSLLNAEGMFMGCTLLTSIDLSPLTLVTNASNMFNGCTSLISLDISGLSSLLTAGGMFSGCTLLELVGLSGMSTITFADFMFSGCSSLVSLDMTPLVGLLSANNMFENCTILEAIDLLGLNGLLYINYMFSMCTSLVSLDVSSLDGVTEALGMFYGCTSLTSVDISAMISLGNLYEFFSGCTSLTEMYIPELLNITYAQLTFYGCTSLEIVDVSGIPNLVSAQSMFWGCTSLTTIDLSSLTNLEDGYSMFRDCTALTSLDLNSLTNLSSVAYMCSGCISLIEVFANDLGRGNDGLDVDGFVSFCSSEILMLVDFGGSKFRYQGGVYTADLLYTSLPTRDVLGIEGAGEIIVTDESTKGDTSIATSQNWLVTLVDPPSRIEVDITTSLGSDRQMMFNLTAGNYTIDWGDGVVNSLYSHNYATHGTYTVVITSTNITGFGIYSPHKRKVTSVSVSSKTISNATNMFQGCYNLSQVDISGMLDISTASGMFKGCTALTSLVGMSSLYHISDISYLFYGLPFTEIDISGFTNVTEAVALFYNCSNLTSITGLSVLYGVSDISGLFARTKLTEIDISGFTSVTEAYGLFQGCSLLTSITGLSVLSSITLADSLFSGTSFTSIDVSDLTSVQYAQNMFASCPNLTSVVGLSALSNVVVSSLMFYKCSSLTSIDISDLVNVSTAQSMFWGTGITSMDISTMTLLEDGYSMFRDCTSLITMDLTQNTKLYGLSNMFTGCTSLESVYASGVGSLSLNDIETAGFVSGCDATKLEVIDFTNARFRYQYSTYDAELLYNSLPTRSTMGITGEGELILTGATNVGDTSIATSKNWLVTEEVLPQIVLTLMDDYRGGKGWVANGFTITSTSDVTVDWGDGTSTTQNGGGEFTKLYSSPLGVIVSISITSIDPITEFVPLYQPGFITAEFNTPDLTTTENLLAGCGLLTSVTLPNSLPNVTNASYMFSGCISLTSIDISFLGSVTNATGLFAYCSTVSSLDVSSLVNVTHGGNLFSGCTSLTSVVGLSSLSNLETAYYMFFRCTSLISIDISDLISITDASFLFTNCENLSSVDVSGLVSITEASSMFNGCASLTSIVGLSSLSNVINTSSLFNECISLTSLNAPNIFTLVTNATSIVSFCSLLEFVDLTGLGSGSTGLSSSYAFFDCDSLTSINLTNAKFTSGAVVSGMYDTLPTVSSGTIDMTGCNFLGDTSIATNKGWTIIS